ncbi:MAG: site-specific integrase [Oscillospiraceae bacterium]|nr:site-specific integrase [Oscillospiraceae bacterium]
MASIQPKRRKNGITYYVVQRYYDAYGKEHQYNIRCANLREAQLLLPYVEAAEREGRKYGENLPSRKKAVAVRSVLTVKELVALYIEQGNANRKWEASTLKSKESVNRNYITPYIGDALITELRPSDIQLYYNDLLTKPAARGNHQGDPGNVTPRTVREVQKILRPALMLAVKQGYIDSNPAIGAELPKEEKYEREQWTEDEFKTALRLCQDPEQRLMMQLMFSCTLRTGELLGLDWKDLHLHPKEGKPYLQVRQELARLSQKAIDDTKTVVYRIFPSATGRDTATKLVLKKPKTDKSVRRIYLSATLAGKLAAHHEEQRKSPARSLDIYQDYGLVFCQDIGRPITHEMVAKRWKKFLGTTELREVGFYSLRHSGATAKLRASHDIKAVQGDMGHSTTDMLMNTYAAIVDEERQKLADEMEQLLFAPDDPVDEDENT